MTEKEEFETQRMNTLAVLDSYFASRSAYPGMCELDEPLILEHKTSADIVDDLAPILPISPQDVFTYLKKNNYRLKTMADGTLCWEIYRDLRYMM